MNNYTGFHFLPPSIHRPPALRPVYDAVTLAPPSASTIVNGGAVVLHNTPTTTDHVLPLVHGQT